MNKDKIIIVGSKNINKNAIARKIIEFDDNLDIVNTFTTDLNLKDKVTDSFEYYMDFDEVQLSFKNNAFMYVTSNELIAKGVTLDSMYAADIVVNNYEDFNNISNKVLETINPIIVWIDSKDRNYPEYKQDIVESKYCFDKLESMEISTLYFRDDESLESIAQTIIDYFYGDTIVREQIMSENS